MIAFLAFAPWALIGVLLYSKRRSAPRWRFYGSPGMPKAPTAQIYSPQTAKTYYAI